jgi:ABC-type thiamin/hydroxymethylpyrimidine transport system permease subunit
LLVKTWFPLVGGTQLVSGHHLLWMVLGYGLTKKKNSILYVGTIKGFIDFLIGSQWGILEIFINLYEGFFLIVGFFLMENIFKEKNTYLGYGVAGGIGNMTQVPLFWFLSGRIYIFPIPLFIMATMFGFASGVVISGMLGKAIVDRIEKAGIQE